MKPSKAKRVRAYESTSDFKERIAALRRTLFHEPEQPRNGSYFKNGYYVTRGRGTPTPSEVLGGAKMPKLPKPPKDIAKWLRSLGVKV